MLSQLLAQRAAESNPIRVGIIGTGKFGAGLVAQISQMKGMEVSAIADINARNAQYAYLSCGVNEEEIRTAETGDELEDLVRAGKPAIVEDGLALTECESIDAVVESTGLPEVGARHAYQAFVQPQARGNGKRRSGRYCRALSAQDSRLRRSCLHHGGRRPAGRNVEHCRMGA